MNLRAKAAGFLAEEDGVGVVEIILILVEIGALLMPCV